MHYSFIVPAFNRPDEVGELLQSMAGLDVPGGASFEVIIADGSPSEILTAILNQFDQKLSIQHLHKPGLGISPSRNLGAQQARGEYLIFLDSDVILPQQYLVVIEKALLRKKIDAFGGPDAAHPTFTPIQKAISYAMTSYLTTGGIRGKKKQVHQYNPRGFNMGIRKTVFEELRGYSDFVCGEDIELSIRIIKAGFTVDLIPEAFVYHKRRTSFKGFVRQVYRFGAARVNIFYRHRNELKLAHLFPAVFLICLTGGLFTFLYPPLFVLYLLLTFLYFGIIFVDASIRNASIRVGGLSVMASLLQLTGYGWGFLANWFTVFVRGNSKGLALGPSK